MRRRSGGSQADIFRAPSDLPAEITGNSADAEEIAQEALLRVWTHAPSWRPVAAFRTWFYRVILNLSLNRRRRAPFLPLEQAGDIADPASDASATLERVETDRELAAAIARLPARQRDAILLTYREGLSNAETAAVLGTSCRASKLCWCAPSGHCARRSVLVTNSREVSS